MERMTVTRRSFLRTSAAAGGACALGGIGCGGGAYAGWDLCIATWGLRYSTGPDIVKTISGLGAVYIDLVSRTEEFGPGGRRDASIKAYHENPDTWKAIQDAMQEYGIKPFQYDSGLGKDLDADRRVMEWAKAQGFKSIMCAPPYESMDAISRLVEEFDLYAAIHNHGPDDPLYKTWQQCLDAVKDQHPNVGFCVDVGHFWRAGVDPMEALEALGPRVHNIHMKDQIEVGGKEQAIIGEGKMDIPAILRALKKIGYDGPMNVEYEMNPENPVPGLSKSLENLREMCRNL